MLTVILLNTYRSGNTTNMDLPLSRGLWSNLVDNLLVGNVLPIPKKYFRSKHFVLRRNAMPKNLVQLTGLIPGPPLNQWTFLKHTNVFLKPKNVWWLIGNVTCVSGHFKSYKNLLIHFLQNKVPKKSKKISWLKFQHLNVSYQLIMSTICPNFGQCFLQTCPYNDRVEHRAADKKDKKNIQLMKVSNSHDQSDQAYISSTKPATTSQCPTRNE